MMVFAHERFRALSAAVRAALTRRRAAATDTPAVLADLETLDDARWRLADTQARYRSLLDTQSDLLMRCHVDGRLIFVNHAYAAAFGLSPNDIVGQHFRPKILASEKPWSQHQDRARSIELIETTCGPRWISWQQQSITNVDGAIEVQRVGHDITEDRRIATELRDARDQADAANRAKSRFLAAMSHEIRTPMNGILGMAGLLRDSFLMPQQQTYLRAIDESARALLHLIDEILDFSKIEAGRIDLACREFVLADCLLKAVDLLRPRAVSKGLGLTCHIDDDVATIVLGDEARVRQIVLNLLANAIKFTDNGSITIRVRSAVPDNQLRSLSRVAIEVKDTGIGFHSDDIDGLFNEFEQGETTLHRHQGGTGLGLAISKRLARAMGGDITAHGRPGEGATFTVMLRLPSALTIQPGSERREPIIVPDHGGAPLAPFADRLGGRQLRVLVAEDNDINALLACRMIEKMGARATLVGNGRAALTAMADAISSGGPYFDIILMDVFMPIMDGFEATSAILGLYSDHVARGVPVAPIVALTANAYPEDRQRCLDAGMSDYLAKPFDAVQLNVVVSKWVATSPRPTPVTVQNHTPPRAPQAVPTTR